MRLCRQMPTRITTIVKRSDGTTWAAHHDGPAAALASLIGRGHQFSFRRAKLLGGHWYVADRRAWRHSDGEFEVMARDVRVRVIN